MGEVSDERRAGVEDTCRRHHPLDHGDGEHASEEAPSAGEDEVRSDDGDDDPPVPHLPVEDEPR